MLLAGEAALAEPAAAIGQAETPPQAQAEPGPFATANRSDDETLQQTRGGAGLTIIHGDNGMIAGSAQDARSENNTVTNTVTGDTNISDNAFQNSNGFLILNANTGNNVAINATMNVNIVTPRSN